MRKTSYCEAAKRHWHKAPPKRQPQGCGVQLTMTRHAPVEKVCYKQPVIRKIPVREKGEIAIFLKLPASELQRLLPMGGEIIIGGFPARVRL